MAGTPRIFFVFVSVALWSLGAQASVGLMAAVDLHRPFTEGHGRDRLEVRGLEVGLSGAIDPIFDGVVSLATHPENGQDRFEIHEAQIQANRWSPGWRFRAGKFFLAMGRLNQTHRHDWSFIQPPKYHRQFFADEGAADTGIEICRLSGQTVAAETHLGVTESFTYGHSHSAGEAPPRPLIYLRQSWFWEGVGTGDFSLGLNALSRESAQKETMNLFGVDLVHKTLVGKKVDRLWQAEFWHRERHSAGTARRRESGFYAFWQRAGRGDWFYGVKLDGYSDHNLRFLTTGELRRDFDYAVGPVATWKPSEFSLVRWSAALDVDTTQGDPDRQERRMDLQFVYILGAHPAHDF